MNSLERKQIGRNDPCPCGSGKKYKHCHMHADREAATQAEIEAEQRAFEERQAQLLERAKAQKQEEAALTRLRMTADEAAREIDPHIQLLYEVWDEFGRAEEERKWEICRSAVDNQLMDDEQVFEFFGVLHRDAVERGLDNRFVQLVVELREKCMEAYQEQIAYIFDWTFPLLSQSERNAFLPILVDDLISHGPDNIEAFFNVVDLLALFGESELYNRVVRATQEAAKSSDLMEWGMDAYMAQYIDTYVFEYLDKTPAELRRDPQRIADLMASHPYKDNLVEDEFPAYVVRLSGERRAWSQDDFPVRTSGRKDDRIPPTTVENTVQLTEEFLAYLRWEKRVPFIKGDLAIKQLRRFLANQDISGLTHKATSRKGPKVQKNAVSNAVLPLAPDREQLDRSLASVMDFLAYQPYKGFALMEIIPDWLQFLEECKLIDGESRAASLRSLRSLVDDLHAYRAHEAISEKVGANLALAWAIPVK